MTKKNEFNMPIVQDSYIKSQKGLMRMKKQRETLPQLDEIVDPPKKIFVADQSKQNFGPILTEEEDAAIKDFFLKHPNISAGGKNEWITTFTGRRFYPLNPNINDIDILDIAHALSNICRFTGHCNSFYSVAQHSVLVSYLCNHENALHGLLHDASEAYICDIASPVKRSEAFAPYREIENTLQEVICQKFGLFSKEPADVKEADKKIFATELKCLMTPRDDWNRDKDPYPFIIDPLPPAQAESLFLTRYRELCAKLI